MGCMQRSYTRAAQVGPVSSAPGSAVQPSALGLRTSADGRRGSLGPTPFCAKPRSVPAPRPPRKKRSVAGQREGEVSTAMSQHMPDRGSNVTAY